MQCPRCHAENREKRRFCAECGAPLALACPECGFSNEPGEKFCGGCGATIAPSSSTTESKHASPQSYTPKHLAERILASRGAIEGERKQVTVLFADIKGSLELMQGNDPEDVRTVLDMATGTMMDAVHRYEGTVSKVLGDGIMALFGAPLAHEDHAVRACYAALAIQQDMARASDELRREHGIEMQVRVGLNSGEVVVRAVGNDLTMDYDAIGQTVHLASRMEQLAIPGTIRAAGQTVRLAEGFVEVRPLGPVPVKGLEAPVEVFELTAATATRTRFQAALTRGLTRFVGRHDELDMLDRVRARAGDGHGQLVAVIGEPGVGKSRLFHEFIRSHHTHGWLVLESGSVSYGKATAYLPLIDLLKVYFRIANRDEPRQVREKVTGKLLTLDEGFRAMLVPLFALLDVPLKDPAWEALDPPQRRRRTLRAIKGLLLRESQIQPVVLVMEDLHWIDSETQAFLDSFVEGLPSARILFLVNYRPEYRHGWGNLTYYTQRRIDPLPAESAEELLDALLGKGPGLGPLKGMLIRRTEGNPFFLEESVRGLVEAGVLAGEPEAYNLTHAVDLIEVPATVQGVLAARIDRLAIEDKQLLQTAAVIGKDVPFALLSAIAELAEANLRGSLANLQAAEFLYETRLFPDPEYTFKHALTHEVAYGSLLQDRRRALHLRIAEAIESLWADRLSEQVDRLAHHFTEAGLAERAVPYWHQAGQRAVERSAFPEAIAHFTKERELLQTLPDTLQRQQRELASQLAVGPALMSIKGWADPEIEQAYVRACEMARRVGRPAQLHAGLWGLWLYNHVSGRLGVAKDLAADLLALAQREADVELLLQAHHAAWTTAFFFGELSACRAHAEQGIALYDRDEHHKHTFVYGGHDPGVCCRDTVSSALWLLGYPDEALARSNEAVGLAREVGHPMSLAIALNSYARLHQHRGAVHLALQCTEATIALCTEHDMGPDYLAAAIILRGWALVKEGQADKGLAEMHRGLASVRATAAMRGRAYYLTLLAEALSAHGDVERALAVLAEAFQQVETTGEVWWESDLCRLKGQLLLARPGHHEDEAEGCFTQALTIAHRQGARSLELRAAMGLAHLRQGQGKGGEAYDLLAGVYGSFTEGLDTGDLRDAKSLLEELA